MSDISITYRKPCGYLRKAEDAAAELQKQLGVDVTLVPEKRLFHFPDAKEIVAAVAGAVKRV